MPPTKEPRPLPMRNAAEADKSKDQVPAVVAGWVVRTVAHAEDRAGASWPLARPERSPHPGDLSEWSRPKPVVVRSPQMAARRSPPRLGRGRRRPAAACGFGGRGHGKRVPAAVYGCGCGAPDSRGNGAGGRVRVWVQRAGFAGKTGPAAACACRCGTPGSRRNRVGGPMRVWVRHAGVAEKPGRRPPRVWHAGPRRRRGCLRRTQARYFSWKMTSSKGRRFGVAQRPRAG
jgi:hypothetical protein